MNRLIINLQDKDQFIFNSITNLNIIYYNFIELFMLTWNINRNVFLYFLDNSFVYLLHQISLNQL